MTEDMLCTSLYDEFACSKNTLFVNVSLGAKVFSSISHRGIDKLVFLCSFLIVSVFIFPRKGKKLGHLGEAQNGAAAPPD